MRSILVLLVVLWTAPIFAAGDYVFITEAEISNTVTTVPAEAAGWRPVRLPRSWSRDELHPDEAGSAWYRIPIPDNLAANDWNHLLMLRHMMNVEIWLNDQFIGSGGPVYQTAQAESGRLQRNWNRPLLLRIPDALLQEPGYFYFRLHSAPNFGVMSPVFIGTQQALSQRYRIHRFVQIDLAKISLITMLFVGSLSLFVWLRNRQRSWLMTGLMSLSWSIPLLYILLPGVPLYEFHFLRLTHWSTVTGALCLLAFIYMHYLEQPLQNLRWLVGIPLLLAVVLLIARDGMIVYIGSFTQLICQVLFIVLLVRLWKQASRPRGEILSIIAGTVVMMVAAAHDMSLVTSSSTARWRWDTPLAYITQPVMLLIVSWHGVKTFIAGVQQVNRANALLQDRLVQAEANIRDVYAEQEQLQRRIRLEAERELVYRDLHDDLGARLLSLVFQSEQAVTRDLARSALQDLRDIVSRVLSEEQPLVAVLADSMTEQAARAEAMKLALDWKIAVGEEISCSRQQLLGLRMLLRELTGQALRLGARDIRYDFSTTGSALQIAQQLDLAEPLPQQPHLLKRLLTLNASLHETALERGRLVVISVPFLACTQAPGAAEYLAGQS